MLDGPNWIAETFDAVERASDVEKARRDAETLTSALENLTKLLPRLAELERACSLGRGSWWTGINAPPDLWDNLRAAQKNLGQRALAAVDRNLPTFTQQAEQAAGDGWKNHIVDEVGNVRELLELSAALRQVPTLEQTATSLDNAIGDLARLRSELPDRNAVETLGKVVALLDDLQARLPAAVRDFVSAATGGGASLEMLDAEVVSWLQDNGAVDAFKIVAGRPTGAIGG
ncbi:hypothetical protein [Pseudonocardia adelaidensis]|uniref:WXG100 family type VII secretion target n=1 Tax=Pseudonocardia adelaidensis TaxID=648754 RepID=A0ABP9NUV8_9PSEU